MVTCQSLLVVTLVFLFFSSLKQKVVRQDEITDSLDKLEEKETFLF